MYKNVNKYITDNGWKYEGNKNFYSFDINGKRVDISAFIVNQSRLKTILKLINAIKKESSENQTLPQNQS